MSKRLGEIIGCKDKTSSWHVNGLSPDGGNIIIGSIKKEVLYLQPMIPPKRSDSFLSD